MSISVPALSMQHISVNQMNIYEEGRIYFPFSFWIHLCTILVAPSGDVAPY